MHPLLHRAGGFAVVVCLILLYFAIRSGALQKSPIAQKLFMMAWAAGILWAVLWLLGTSGMFGRNVMGWFRFARTLLAGFSGGLFVAAWVARKN